MSSTNFQERIASSYVCCGGDKLSRSPAILMPFVAARVFDWYPVEIDENILSVVGREKEISMLQIICRLK